MGCGFRLVRQVGCSGGANLRTCVRGPRLVFQATRDIAAGEELLA